MLFKKSGEKIIIIEHVLVLFIVREWDFLVFSVWKRHLKIQES